MTDPFSPMELPRGGAMKNRFMLAPLTNMQSNPDGTLSDEEIHWLVMRAQGGFALTMTAAAHVQQQGRGFHGQLGIWSDEHVPGLTRLARDIHARGSLCAVQLHHAGRRSPADLIGTMPVCPWDDKETGARALTTAEVEQLIEDFILAGLRAEAAGFDGIEIHGAHGYIVGQFLDAENNHRVDRYGGSFANRRGVLDAIIDGLRDRAGPDFQIGVRISPERFGIRIQEALELAESLMASGKLDYLDMSLWNCVKVPEDPDFASKPLIDWFAAIPRGNTRLGVAGKLITADDVQRALATGVDFVLLGRAAILHHNFPHLMQANPDFASVEPPVSRDYLRVEGLSESFVDYMAGWKGFVSN